MILGAVNANRNPFIYLNNMGSVMTSAKFRAAMLFAAAGLLAFPMGSMAWGQASGWVGNERGAVRLVSAVKAVGQADAVDIGLEIRLKPGWKTYWRISGESGMPPRFDWSASVNLAGAAVTWPGPTRFTIAGMQSYGYGDHVILPVRVALAEPGKPLSLRLHLRYANCREVCVPEEAKLSLDLPAGIASPGAHARTIAAYAARAPQPGAKFGWTVESATVVESGDGAARRAKLVVEVASTGIPFAAPELVVEGAERLHFGMSSVKLTAAGQQARFYIPLRRAGDAANESLGDLALTLLDGQRHGTFAVRVGASH